MQNGHASPFEHVAQSMTDAHWEANPHSGNFTGWAQLRKTLPNENRSDSRVVKRFFNLEKATAASELRKKKF
jgi:hypothetical protein